MKRYTILSIAFLFTLSICAFTVTAATSSSQGVSWSNMRGVAYRSASNSYVCYQGLPSCDSPTVTSPSASFATYKAAGFNFARISLDWRYLEQNPSGFETILSSEASSCDANGINCYYMWSASSGSYVFPADVMKAWGCSTNACFAGEFVQNAVIPSGTGTPYDGLHVWQAAWNALKPAIQTVDSHSSTVGYSFLNEPNSPWTQSEIQSYYLFMAQQLRTVSSKAFIFQANAGGSGGGGSYTIQQLAPTSYGPYVFEIHNYQGANNYNPYPSVVSQCNTAGCAGVLLGEWGGSSNPPTGYSSENQYITDELNAVKQNGMANQWFDWSGISILSSGALNTNGVLLSQLVNQILGGTQSTTTTSSSKTSTTTSTTKSSSSSTTAMSTTSTSTHSTTTTTSISTTTSTSKSSTSSTTSSTTSKSTSTSTSQGSSSTTTFLSSASSSSSSYSSSSTSSASPGTTTTQASTTSIVVSSSTSSTFSSQTSTSASTQSSQPATMTSVNSTSSVHSSHRGHNSTSTTYTSSTTSTAQPVIRVTKPILIPPQSPGTATGAYLFPSSSTVAAFTGTIGSTVFALVVFEKLKERSAYRSRFKRRTRKR